MIAQTANPMITHIAAPSKAPRQMPANEATPESMGRFRRKAKLILVIVAFLQFFGFVAVEILQAIPACFPVFCIVLAS